MGLLGPYLVYHRALTKLGFVVSIDFAIKLKNGLLKLVECIGPRLF